MKNFTLSLILIFASVSLVAQKLPFQGYLEESGIPVNGTRTFNFELPDYGWSETIADVPIDNGIYNVILGDSIPLPNMIFSGTTETPLGITVDGVSIGIATLYKPLVNTNSLLTADGNLEIKGPNDSLNLRVGSFNPYYGSVNLYDSLGAQQGFLSADPLGGRLQLNQRNGSGALTSAIVARTNGSKSFSQYYGLNPSGTGITRLMENYITEREIASGPIMSGGYLRSGSDWYDNEGTLLAAIGNAREEGGGDPTGKSGFLSLWGSNSFNAQLTGKRWVDNNLPTFDLFGDNDDGADWWMRNFYAEVNPGGATDNYSNLGLLNTDNGGISTETIFMTSNDNSTGAGLIEVRDSSGTATASLNAGTISLNRPSDGNSAINMFQFNGTGGLSIQDASNIGRFLFIGGEGNLILRNSTEVETIKLESQTGNIVVSGTVTAEGQVLTSDQRFKKEIKTIENALDKTLKLRGTTYYWKDEKKSNEIQIGVIAQEVEEVYPEFVHTNKEGYKAVNYAQMTAVLIEAIKELNTKVENLEKENESLTSALNESKLLSEKIDKLEKLLLQNQKVASN